MNSLWARSCLLAAFTILLQEPSSNRRRIYAHAYLNPEVRECRDRKRYAIRRKGQRYKVCDWVAEKPEIRCNKPIIKRRKVKNSRIRIDPKEYCGCTCASSADVVDDVVDAACPLAINDPINEVHQSSCGNFERGKTCNFEWIWVGCTYAELRCQPITRCTCGNIFSATQAPAETPTQAPLPEDWICAMSVVPYCPPSREEPVPPERHQSCTENETPPLPPIIL